LLRLVHGAIVLLMAGTMLAQTAHDKKEAAQQPPAAQEQVAPDDMVILITGACRTPPGEFAVRDCIRGVTREEFEKLVAATNPNATPEYRKKLAEALGQIIIYSNEAKKRGLPKDPAVQELLRFAQLQTLASQLLAGSLRKEAAATSEADIESYYKAHASDFQSAEFLRLTIPRKSAAAEASDDDKQFAESIRARCAAGEDVAKLQQEALQRAERPPSAPADLKNQRRAMFPAAQQSIFDLKTGECSPVIADAGEFRIYKLVNTTTAALPEVHDAIAKAIEAERVKNEIEQLNKSNIISLNNKYFTFINPSSSKPASPEAKPNSK
jgi:PPIC-type PPIASE domain